MRAISPPAQSHIASCFQSNHTTGIVSMPDPVITQRTVHVEHIKIEISKPFAEVKAALEELVPTLDSTIPEALRQGDIGRAKEALQRGPPLAIFSARDHGGLLRIAGIARKAVQYEIGNPLTATRMTQRELPASLYAPLRVVLYENEDGRAVFEYDRPSSLFGQFGDERVTWVARELDASLESLLVKAAG